MKITDKITMIHGDCMDYMAGLEDGAFELAIVDPPYGIGAGKKNFGKWRTSRMKKKNWDASPPLVEYFDELRRVSVNQIVWGGNYFPLPSSRGFIVWDKGNGFKGRDFAECELAWISFDCSARIFKRDPLANGDYHDKFHPTQKPVALYKWLLTNYAKPGDRILDTHGGSGSIAIACHDLGFELVWIEKDEDYYKAAVQRVKQHAAQLQIFQQ